MSRRGIIDHEGKAFTAQFLGDGQGMLVLEAMKMENELRADASATVRDVLVEPGQTVNRDDLLVVLE